mgnify:FL=1
MKKQLLLILTAIILSWSANAQMVLEFNTNLSDGTTITLPLYGTVDVTVNWGDGASDTYTAAGNHEHIYAAEGTYTVSITGMLTQFGGGKETVTPNIDKLIKVTSFGNIGLISLFGAFYGASNLVDLPSQLPSTVLDLSYMLRGASIFNGDIGDWDVSNVTDMSYIFLEATVFNKPIGSWNVSNVNNMVGMFRKATAFNQDISSWDVSNVTNMATMFYEAFAFDQNIGNWDVSNVTNMSAMFRGATVFNQNINTKVVNPGESNEYVAWDVSNVTNMSSMFLNAKAFNGNVSSWDVTNVTDMWSMFYGTVFNQNINTKTVNPGEPNEYVAWDVSNVTNMGSLFSRNKAFNQNIGGWNVSKVTNMSSMFIYADKFNQDISSWDVSNVTNMKWMFCNAKAFDQNIGGWNITSVTDMTEMFLGATLSTANYNNILIGWAAQTVKNNVSFHGGNSQYSPGAAADARAVLTGTYNWTITDGGVLNVLTVLTIAPSEITATTATSGGNITADGGSPVTARGVVWSETENPTIETNTGITTDGTGMGTFTSSITGLTENTTYHVRAYATNANGTEYGENMEFIAKDTSPVFTVTFTVTDNSVPLAEATISINEQTLTTGTDGIATIELENGVYPYTVSATDFVTHEGSITVEGVPVDEDVCLLHVGVSSNLLSNIGVYPNPTSGILNFNFAGEQVQTIKVVDITGKTVLEKTNVNPSETLDISNLANGLYLVVVQTNKENISYKIIKE